MKKVIYIFISLLIVACSSENANDCFQASGKIIQQEVDVPDFEKILVNRDIEVILSEGSEINVIIETGKNLMNDVEVVVADNELRLTDNNNCNYVRDYGITKIYITAPNITEIRSSTQYDISSQGILNFNSLSLISEDFNAPDTFTVGDFRLNINSVKLNVVANNISSFYITGVVENLYVGFFAGAGRFEGQDLIAENVDVFHRGSNDMIINPQQSISGEIRGVGDVIAVNQPPTVTLEQFYTGALIFKN